jgi:hypothetical protein
MESKVILKFNAIHVNCDKELFGKIQSAINNSTCRTLQLLSESDDVKFTIQVSSDKILKLYDELKNTGIEFELDYSGVVQNASTQYSVFREIELELFVRNHTEIELTQQQFNSSGLPFIAL